MQVSLGGNGLVSFGCAPRSAIAGRSVFALLRNLRFVFTAVVPVGSPNGRARGVPPSTSWPAVVSSGFFLENNWDCFLKYLAY